MAKLEQKLLYCLWTHGPGASWRIRIHQRHRQTDRRTDRRHAIAIPRFAL